MVRIDSVSASPPISSLQSSSKAQKKTTKASRLAKGSISSKKIDSKEKASSCWEKTYALGKKILTKTKEAFYSLFKTIKGCFANAKPKKKHAHKKSKSTKAPSILKKSKKDIKKKPIKDLEPEELKKPSSPIVAKNIQDLPREHILNALSTRPKQPPPSAIARRTGNLIPGHLLDPPTKPKPDDQRGPPSATSIDETPTPQGSWSALRKFQESPRILAKFILQDQISVFANIIEEIIASPSSLETWYDGLNLAAWNQSTFDVSHTITSYLENLLGQDSFFVTGDLYEKFQNLLKKHENKEVSDFVYDLQNALRAWNYEDVANSLDAKMKEPTFIAQIQQALGNIFAKTNA